MVTCQHPLEMGEEILWKWPNFPLWRARDLDLKLGDTAYRHASLVDLYLQTKFHRNQRNFWWTYERTYGWTYETHFIRL